MIAEKIVSLANKMSQKRKPGEDSDPLMWEEFGTQYYSKKDDIIRSDNALFCDKELVGIAKKVQYRNGKVTVGTVGCAEVWNKEADLIAHYRKTKGTDCEAKEGVGVAQTCAAFGVPMVEIRVISNNELLENEHLSPETAENGQKFVLELLKLL